MNKLILLAALSIAVVSAQSSSGCRYWCKTPEEQAYCCENDNQVPVPVVSKKKGKCPPVRPKCPATRFGPPETCAHDGVCPGIEKCCFDRCLEQHVCKTPLFGGDSYIGGGSGGFGGGQGGGSGGFGNSFGGGRPGRPGGRPGRPGGRPGRPGGRPGRPGGHGGGRNDDYGFGGSFVSNYARKRPSG